MKTHRRHDWTTHPREAVALQRRLRARVITDAAPLERVDLVGGADVSWDGNEGRVYGGVVVLDRRRGWEVVDRSGAEGPSAFPYVPGLLSFRELPILLEAFAGLRTTPQVMIFDGQGLAHPRRIGLASHAGLWIEIPSIGCAKTRYIGRHREPGERRGCHVALLDDRDDGAPDVIGRVVRTRDGCRPVYVSVGHRIGLADAVRIVLLTARGYRIPEPTRQAHRFVNKLRCAAGPQTP